jgi:hypothetical protein
MIIYEKMLDRDAMWALREGSMHFEEESAVHKTLRQLLDRLDRIGVSYALAAGMSLFFHGYRRFTEYVDLLVTREGLATIREKLEGLGYEFPFAGSKHLRDTNTGVRVKFLVTGDYPADGKPKPVSFPDPLEARIKLSGVYCLTLPKLVELKLASGMTNPARLGDLADVQNLIRLKSLPEEFAQELHPFVQAKYLELWQAVRADLTSES